MKIGIIGASLAGLVAGDKLAKAGHDVTVIEKERKPGGRLATHYMDDNNFFDYGIPFLKADGDTFKEVVNDLGEKKMVHQWMDELPIHDGSHLHKMNRNKHEVEYYAADSGFNSIADHLKRWVDIKSQEQAGGLTYIGMDRGKKRTWMVNLTDISVFECDAVILAAPAPQAYGVLQTAQDETAALRIIREIDGLHYKPRYVLMASYNREIPSWKGIKCIKSNLSWISNESSKSTKQEKTNIVIHSSPNFVKKHFGKDPEEIESILLKQAGRVVGESWLERPDYTNQHFWRYYQAEDIINEDFMELEKDDAPLALIGDYFKGKSPEAAYLSAISLADYWIEKYSETVSVNI
ncbi:MAG TPA: FAD-dependent oxidoreductase [Balneolaceae bacterium]|nr:FAD-dependent oxidoreductase [Balneolaceae bacterium]